MKYIIFIFAFLVAAACNDTDTHEQGTGGHDDEERTENTVLISARQTDIMGLETGPLPVRSIAGNVETIGELEVPPQSHAVVTAMIGANVESIKVLEATKVRKNSVLAYLTHPSLIDLQNNYAEVASELEYIRKEYERRKDLYEQNVESGQMFQKAQAEFRSLRGRVKADAAKLRLLGLDPVAVANGEIEMRIPLRSPIGGYVKYVHIKTGQYLEPQTPAFEVVDISQIHADFMVYEKDMSKVREGQKVRFVVQTLPDKELTAKVFAVGKAFENDPKALHVHAAIDNKEGLLLPGMYITGEFLLDAEETTALPEAAIVREGDRYFAFVLVESAGGHAHAKDEKDHADNDNHTKGEKGHTDNDENTRGDKSHVHSDENAEKVFRPVEVIPGNKRHGWVAVSLLEELPQDAEFALNNAYYLMAEMKKGEAEHAH